MRNDMFLNIEEKLSNLLHIIDTEAYLNFIQSNESLKKYDDIMGKIDNGDYPENYKDQITDEMLAEILNLIDEKINS